MFTKLRSLGLAVALALTPLAASAVTYNPGNTVEVNATTLSVNIDIVNDFSWRWSADFGRGDTAKTYTFVFHNTTDEVRTFDFDGTVMQGTATFANIAGTTSGVIVTFGDFTKTVARSATRAWDTTEVGTYTNTVDGGSYLYFAPGETKTLTIRTGRVVGTVANSGATISFDASTPSTLAAVPVPASAVLLGSGLLGLAGLRRRRKAA